MNELLQDGRYTLVYGNGEYRTLRVKTARKGGLAGKVILSYKNGSTYEGIAFLLPGNAVKFWSRFIYANTHAPERLTRIEAAVRRIVENPTAAQMAYAMRENACARCGKALTVPASIHKGLGPECARKRVTRQDNEAVFEAMREQAS